MSLISENPVLFVKQTCPFCLKVRLYLLEAGLLGGVTLRVSRTPEEEDAMKAELSPHLKDLYICSLSNQTLTYKGQLTPEQLYGYYGDLQVG